LIFLRDIVSLKPMIVLIICHFLISVKFCSNIKIPQKKANSMVVLEIPRLAKTVGPSDVLCTVITMILM